MVSPAWMGSEEPPSGGTSETYFSPNRVLGTIEPVTSAGIVSVWSGKSPSVSSAPSPLDSISRTSPTMTPRILTSARAGSWRPILEVSRVTSS